MSRTRSTEAVGGAGAAAGGRQFFRLPPRCGLSNLADLVSCGAIAQLGERYNGIVEVTGSIPVGSTNEIRGLGITFPSPFCFPNTLLTRNAGGKSTPSPRNSLK